MPAVVQTDAQKIDWDDRSEKLLRPYQFFCYVKFSKDFPGDFQPTAVGLRGCIAYMAVFISITDDFH